MTFLVLVVLAVIWAAVLVPPALRARAEARPADSISAFRRQLTVLRRARPTSPRSLARSQALGYGPSAPVTSLASRRPAHARSVGPQALAVAGLPSARSRTLRRRRDVLVGLLVAVGVSLLLALIVPVMLIVNLVADVLLLSYVALLVRQRNRAAERDMKVRFLPGPRSIEPALLRRSVN